MEDDKIERVCTLDWDSPPFYDVYSDNDNLVEVMQVMHITYFPFLQECNLTGLRFSLHLVKISMEYSERILEGSPFCNGHWMVSVDAAKGCATKPPD